MHDPIGLILLVAMIGVLWAMAMASVNMPANDRIIAIIDSAADAAENGND